MSRMEAKGIGASDVQEVERYLTRLQAQNQVRQSAKTVRPSAAVANKSVLSPNHSAKSPSPFPPEPPDLQLHRLLQPTVMKLAFDADRSPSGRPQSTPALGQNRSADPQNKRSMAIDCGLKSIPVNDSKKWLSTATMSLPPSRRRTGRHPDSGKSHGPSLQSQVLHLAAEENATVKRGLSGSKIRCDTRTPRPDSRTPRFDFLESSVEHREGSILISASPRAQSIRYTPSIVTASVENENCRPSKSGHIWNKSDQSLRLQKQLRNLNSTRAMKRASEMVQHRLDHMYLMSGNKLVLQHRYNIDDMEMRKLQEMTQTREDLASDLKKMKYPYGLPKPGNYPMNSLQLQSRQGNSHEVNQVQPTFITNASPGIHPTPASELDSARDNVPKFPQNYVTGKDMVNDGDDDNDYYDDEINSWNGPL